MSNQQSAIIHPDSAMANANKIGQRVLLLMAVMMIVGLIVGPDGVLSNQCKSSGGKEEGLEGVRMIQEAKGFGRQVESVPKDEHGTARARARQPKQFHSNHD